MLNYNMKKCNCKLNSIGQECEIQCLLIGKHNFKKTLIFLLDYVISENQHHVMVQAIMYFERHILHFYETI